MFTAQQLDTHMWRVRDDSCKTVPGLLQLILVTEGIDLLTQS